MFLLLPLTTRVVCFRFAERSAIGVPSGRQPKPSFRPPYFRLSDVVRAEGRSNPTTFVTGTLNPARLPVPPRPPMGIAAIISRAWTYAAAR